MSPDTVDHILLEIADFIEEFPVNWADNDAYFEAYSDRVHELLEPYLTRDRNYN